MRSRLCIAVRWCSYGVRTFAPFFGKISLLDLFCACFFILLPLISVTNDYAPQYHCYHYLFEFWCVSFVWYSFGPNKAPHLLSNIPYCLINEVQFSFSVFGGYVNVIVATAHFYGCVGQQKRQHFAAFSVLLHYATVWINRISIVAASARVACPCGFRCAPLPTTMPAPHAHCMAGIAYSLIASAST